MHKHPIQHGFTLIEILVTLAIFMSAISAVGAIFLFSNNTQRKTAAIQQTQTDARFAMEVMAQQVRKGSIDYDSSEYSGSISSNPQEVLVLRDADNNQVWFQKGTNGSRGVVQISDDGSSWNDITPTDISVDLLQFYISPTTNPFATSPSTNQQPMVTIVLTTSNVSTEGEGLPPTRIQTTISSRQYVR